MKPMPKRQAYTITAAVFALCFILSLFYSLFKTRLEIEEKYDHDVQKAYDETIRTEQVDVFRKKGFEEGRKKAEPDPGLLARKQKVEKDLADLKAKAIEEMKKYDREKICQIAYRSGVARGESDARKNWSVEYWDEKTGVDLGKIISIGKKIVRMQLKYRNFPVGAPLEVDVEKDVTVDKSVVCGLMKGFQWANPASYQFFEGIKKDVCGTGRLDKSEIIPKEDANEKFWDSLEK
jgi:hypothetical protein